MNIVTGKGVLEAAGFTYNGKKAALDTAVKNSLEAYVS